METSRSQMLLSDFERDFPYQFRDRSLLVTAFVAGDIDNPNNREGHRSLAQLRDTMMAAVILNEGFARGISRKRLQETVSSYRSKAKCGELARLRNLDHLVRISGRQCSIGPQPTTLKNTIAAIVGAVWRDSQDYRALVQVMGWLGLVNHNEPSTSPANQLTTEPSRASIDQQVTPESVHCTDVAPIDTVAYVELDIIIPAFFHEPIRSLPDQRVSTDLAEGIGDGDLGIMLHGSQNMYGTSAPFLAAAEISDVVNTIPEDTLLANPMTGVEDSIPFNYGTGLADPTTNEVLKSWSSSHPLGTEVELSWNQLAPHADHGILCSNPVFPVSQPEKQRDPNRQYKISKKTRTSHTQDIDVMFQVFIRFEKQKIPHQDAECAQHCTRLLSLKNALTLSSIPNQRSLAKMAMSFGNGSAMKLLKHAIAGARSSSVPSFPMLRKMSVEQRLKAIHHLDVATAAFRLARRLQILMLYEEATQEIGGQDANGFVMESGTGYSQAVQGNPRHLEQNAIALHMRSHTSSTDRVETLTPGEKRMLTRLRRMGKRLQRMVSQWGLGVLALLDHNFSDVLLMTLSDRHFDKFVEIMNQVEGPVIQILSNAADCAIPLFWDGAPIPSRFRIEEMDGVVLEKLPWLSPAMEALFVVVD